MSEEVKQVVVLDRDSKLSPRVALLYSMMVKTRENLLQRVDSLTTAVIDFSPDFVRIETMGTLLLHIAAIEWSWVFEDILGEEMNYEKWKHAFSLREDIDQLTGKEIDFYLKRLSEVRKGVVDWLKSISDDDVDTLVEVGSTKVTIEWILFHLIEHEAMHIGQISFLNRLRKQK
ncbi:MAG: DinB family protein [Candidatus Thorarchaeota archaeon]|jgi:uncharacterized damage-inducible protein DinB